MRAYRFLIVNIFLVYFFVLVQGLSGQERGEIRGVVLSKADGRKLPNIEVLNLTSKEWVRTRNDGSFRIAAFAGDSIEFRHPNWEVAAFRVKDMPSTVYLIAKANLIEGIVVSANSKAKQIAELKSLKSDFSKNAGIYYEGKPPISLLNPFGGKPITFFYELFSANGRKVRQKNKMIQSQIEELEIDQFFNKFSIQKAVDIPEDQIDDFMLQYRPPYKVCKSWKLYDYQMYIVKSYAEFQKSK